MSLPLPLRIPPHELVNNPLLREHDVLLRVLRLDQMHPTLHGNKWFKLKHNIQFALDQRIPAILSFGGAYSNHLYALAAAGEICGLRTIGMVRGELPDPLNPVLAFARSQGMELVAMSRADYRCKTDPDCIASLRQRFGEFYLIPEGGSNALAVAGCAEIAAYIQWQSSARPRYIGLACGTGSTLAGLVTGLAGLDHQSQTSVLGIGVLQTPGYLSREVQGWLPAGMRQPWAILDGYHCGGYAKVSPQLTAFLQDFADFSALPLEPVYTGKLFFGLFDQIRRGLIPPGSEVIALHTGGIYGEFAAIT